MTKEQRDELRRLLEAATPGEWEARDVSGAGWEVRGVLPQGLKFDCTCRGADGQTSFQTWTLASPQMVLVACERWVQFETAQWKEMQAANAAFIQAAHNQLGTLLDKIEELERERDELRDIIKIVSLDLSVASEMQNLTGEEGMGQIRRAWRNLKNAISDPASRRDRASAIGELADYGVKDTSSGYLELVSDDKTTKAVRDARTLLADLRKDGG